MQLFETGAQILRTEASAFTAGLVDADTETVIHESWDKALAHGLALAHEKYSPHFHASDYPELVQAYATFYATGFTYTARGDEEYV